MKKFLFLLVLLSTQVNAQFDAKGEWSFPTSIRTLCIDTEQRIVSSYQNMVVQNRLGMAAKDDEKHKFFTLGAAYKDSQIEYMKGWEQLGCASILYQKK